ncbi:MAG: branched-chain amino acid ABC transporter permease [Candidatus Saccharimonas sp.]|nr:branched-chain amino acid ABC transporter permease [Planctomycetaceae bacterium]
MLFLLLADAASPSAWEQFLQHCLIGLTTGSLIALIALGYTMVYGIIGLINFAHGDLFMLGAFLALTLLTAMGVAGPDASASGAMAGLAVCFLLVPVFCGGLNWAVDRIVYKPLRNAPKLAPLVSAIGVSFIFMNVGLLWGGAADLNFPKLVSEQSVWGVSVIQFTLKDLLVIVVTVPIMVGLTLFVKFTRLGKAMRAVEQNPVAAQLMGIHVDRVIGATFVIGGSLAGMASVVYGLYINTISFQMGFQNGLYAFTAAVLGGIGKLPGAVLGGLIIGLARSLGSAYIGERWTGALIFAILIVILIFRPAGLLGRSTQDKV